MILKALGEFAASGGRHDEVSPWLQFDLWAKRSKPVRDEFHKQWVTQEWRESQLAACH